MKLTANPAWLALSPHCDKASGAKFLRIMKLTTIIILAACLHTSAKGVAQQTITFSGKEVSLESVFSAIKKQTNYRFFFNTDMLSNASKVTLEVKNANIEQVMNMALKDQPLTFTIKGRTIFVMKKPEEEKKSTQVERTGDPITVSGRVTDENGEPLVGANVKVKGGNNGATTDAQGRFTLNNVDPNASLEITFVGRETEILSVKGKTVFSVALGQKVGALDETVVIAYGTTTRRFNTGNVSSVKASDIEKQPVNNPLLALQGRVPGLYITQANGLAGSGVTVRIQGQNSIGKGNDPLYIVDGVPYPSQMISTIQGGPLGGSGGPIINGVASGGGNPLSYLNTSNIESIEVLKDADATAIYGSRGANGVIIITTKKGKAGKTKLDLNGYSGWGSVSKKLDLLNTTQYLEMRREAKKNDNATITASDYDINGLWDTTMYTDWQKVLIGNTAKYSHLDAAVSGGNGGVQYLVSGTFHRETTVFPGDFADQKGALYFNLNTSSSNQRFHFTLSANYLSDKNEIISTDLTTFAVKLAPNAPAGYNLDGTLNWMPNASGASSWDNPFSYLLKTYRNQTKNLVGNSILSYRIIPGLEIETSIGYNHLQTNEFNPYPLAAESPQNRINGQRLAVYSNNSTISWNIEPMLTYRKKFGYSKLDFLLGSTIFQNSNNGQMLAGIGHNSDFVLEDINSAATIVSAGTVISMYKYNAAFVRINYNLKDRYIINLNARRDGSSRFGRENQFHNFGSIGAAWIFSQENFFKRNFSVLSFGKIKVSYGTTGNDQIGDYQYLSLNKPINASVPYQNTTALVPNGLYNAYLQWENSKKMQIGLELGFLNDRVLLNGIYARNRSSNQLLSYNVPIITGFQSIIRNLPATVQNSSYEFALSTVNVKTKNFNWATNINLTIPENKLIKFPNLEKSSYASLLVVGQPLTVTKLYHFLGVDPATGSYQVADSHGDPTFSPNNVTDRTVFVSTLPRFYGGFDNHLKFKNVEVSILVQFVKQVASGSFFGNLVPGAGIQNQPKTVLRRWQKSGDIAEIQKFNSNYGYSNQYLNAIVSDANYSDASFVRVKNMSLSWELPGQVKDLLHFQKCRLYVQGQNLITFSKYKGLDPENRSTNSLPPLRVVTIGLQISL